MREFQTFAEGGEHHGMIAHNIAAPQRMNPNLRRLALAGNAYRGIGIPDCIRGGESAAEALLNSVQEDRA